MKGKHVPYVDKSTRKYLDTPNSVARSAGDLNYKITKECENYRTTYGDSYETFNKIIGVLECAKLEYYRRIVAEYENSKLNQNGDVYHAV